jgi:hypothetical protein
MSKRIHIGDEGTALAGAKTPSSHRPAEGTRKPVILIHQHPSAAASDAGDATALEGFEPLGVVAVRLFAQWKLPRMQMKRPEGLGGEE